MGGNAATAVSLAWAWLRTSSSAATLVKSLYKRGVDTRFPHSLRFPLVKVDPVLH